jgi:hypothetical protein
VVVLLSSCWDGTGSDEMIEPFDGARDAEEVLARLREHYTIEMNETFNIARFLTVCPRVVACCPGVPDRDLRRLFFTPAPTPEAALDKALEIARDERAREVSARAPRRPSVLLFPRAHRALFGAALAGAGVRPPSS